VAANAIRSLINAKRSIMEKVTDDFVPTGLHEKKNIIKDESGYHMQLEQVGFNEIDLKWGRYINPQERVMSFQPAKPAIVSHFRMLGSPGAANEKGQYLKEKEFVIYRESTEAYNLYIEPNTKPRVFFELGVSDNFFNSLFTEESGFMQRFHNHSTFDMPSLDFTAQMLPAMYSVINNMQYSPYTGYLKGVYLEAKAIELFLMQVNQLDRENHIKHSKLKPKDIDSLYEVRNHLELNYNQLCSITGMAQKAGINQMKLKNGFKELFNTTVFGYLTDVRMQEAKRLLLDEKLYVNEVADKVGYKHPHHFTAAFKKKFGMVPKDLKE